MTDYDALYQNTPNALGPQDPGVGACLLRLPAPPLRILDFGAGQGRDALPLARQGHAVTAIDPAPSGLKQIAGIAEAEQLDITCQVGTAKDVAGEYDVLLSNRTLHMILDDGERHTTLTRLLSHLAPGGHVLIEDERSNIPGLRNVMGQNGNWDWLEETPARLFARRKTG